MKVQMPVVKSTLNHNMNIRWLLQRDIPEVMEIEQNSFEFPYDEEQIIALLRECNVIGVAAEQGDKIKAYMLYRLHKGWLEIISMAVHPDWRHQHIGTQCVDKLKSKLHQQSREKIVTIVAETNLEAQLFFSKQGFVANKILKEHFVVCGRHIDGYEFIYRKGW